MRSGSVDAHAVSTGSLARGELDGAKLSQGEARSASLARGREHLDACEAAGPVMRGRRLQRRSIHYALYPFFALTAFTSGHS